MADAPANPVLQVLSQLKQLWGRQPRGRKTLAVTAAFGLAAILAFTQLSHTTTEWQLVTDASPDDTQELYAALTARNLPVRLRAGKVEVETDRLGEARAIAAAAGLPRSGKGFELFDKTNLGQSSFSEQVNFRRALQGELSRSIASLAQVQPRAFISRSASARCSGSGRGGLRLGRTSPARRPDAVARSGARCSSAGRIQHRGPQGRGRGRARPARQPARWRGPARSTPGPSSSAA
ncbi:MAG: hypothetical protein WKG01_38350 [Kofleriaceae bacterium]